MQNYILKVDAGAIADIQEISDWYKKQKSGLGKSFQISAIKQINSFNKNPQIYTIRYKEIRCALVKKFPYMVHFYINDDNNTVEVLAVISTSRNPKIWTEKTSKEFQ